MAPVNVLVSGLPTLPTLCLHIGDGSNPITSHQVSSAIVAATGLPRASFFLRLAAAPLPPDAIVALPQQDTAFVNACVRRALPGGKGGFGANLKGSAASRTTDYSACRDLQGRTIRQVQQASAIATLLQQEQTPNQQSNQLTRKRTRSDSVTEKIDKEKDQVDVEQLHDAMIDVSNQIDDAIRIGKHLNSHSTKAQKIDHPHSIEQPQNDPMALWVANYHESSSSSDDDSQSGHSSKLSQDLEHTTPHMPVYS